jgi:hypothetical protein
MGFIKFAPPPDLANDVAKNSTYTAPLVTHTTPIYRKNNSDDQLGTTIEMQDLCVKYNPDSAVQYMPQNGEYGAAGTGSGCNACLSCEPFNMSVSSGCEGPFSGCVSGAGSHPMYTRVSYKAPQDACCTSGGVSTIGNLTCDPKYRGGPDTSACFSTFNTKCVDSALAGSDCQTWCDKNQTDCLSRTRSYCNKGNNMGTQFCKDQAKMIGGMDLGVTNWCSGNKTDPFCSCYSAVNSSSSEIIDPETKAILSRPECYVTTCSSGTGYKYDSMKTSGSCPSVNLCKNTITIAGNLEGVDLNNVKQSCVQSIVSTTTAPTTAPSTVSNPASNPVSAPASNPVSAPASNPAPASDPASNSASAPASNSASAPASNSASAPASNSASDPASKTQPTTPKPTLLDTITIFYNNNQYFIIFVVILLVLIGYSLIFENNDETSEYIVQNVDSQAPPVYTPSVEISKLKKLL